MPRLGHDSLELLHFAGFSPKFLDNCPSKKNNSRKSAEILRSIKGSID